MVKLNVQSLRGSYSPSAAGSGLNCLFLPILGPDKGLMGETIALHVCFRSLYISLPFSVKQHNEKTKFCMVGRAQTATANFSYFYLELNVFFVNLV